MKAKRKCPNCDVFLLIKEFYHGVGPPGPSGKLPDIEISEGYICPKCGELFFDEDLEEKSNQKI